MFLEKAVWMKIERFEDIEGWQLGRKLSKAIYSVSRKGEFARDYGLRDQIQRASGSVMHNIAEGFDGGSNAEFIKFLRYSKRSCTEVQSELWVALDQEYVTETEFNKLYDMARTARSKIGAFIKYLDEFEKRKKQSSRTKTTPESNREP